MSATSDQFQTELNKLIKYYYTEGDITIGEAFSILQWTALDLRDLVKEASQDEEGEPE